VVLVSNLPPSPGSAAPGSGGGLKDIDPGIPTEYLVGGAVVVGGGIAAGILLTENKKDPVSP